MVRTDAWHPKSPKTSRKKEELAMCKRHIRAVLLDVHGTLFVKDVPDFSRIPAAGRAHWAECFGKAVKQELGLEYIFDPLKLWRFRAEIELRTPRERNGRPITPRQFQLRVNELVLIALLPDLMNGIQPKVRRRMARAVHHLRRTEEGALCVPADMLEFSGAIKDRGLRLYLHTAQVKKKVYELIGREEFPGHFVDGIHTTESIGFSKMRVEFWSRLLENIGLKPQETVVVGNNLIMDSSCTVAGIPAFILDRDGEQEKLFAVRDHLRGAKFVLKPDGIPPQAPFIVFGRVPTDFLKWVDNINATEGAIGHPIDTKAACIA